MRNYIKAYYPCTTRGRLQKYLMHQGVQIPHQDLLNKYIYTLTYKLEEMCMWGTEDKLEDRVKEFANLIGKFYLQEITLTKGDHCTKKLITYIPDECNELFWDLNMTPITKKEIEEYNKQK